MLVEYLLAWVRNLPDQNAAYDVIIKLGANSESSTSYPFSGQKMYSIANYFLTE